MKLKQIKEARYYKQHPWLKKYIEDLEKRNVEIDTDLPDDIDSRYVVSMLTQVYGKPDKWEYTTDFGKKDRYQFVWKLPSHTEDFDTAIPYLYYDPFDHTFMFDLR